MRRLGLAIALGCCLSLAACAGHARAALPPIHHVFVIVLENQGYAATFGNPAADPYLASTLPAHSRRDNPSSSSAGHRAPHHPRKGE